MEASPDVLEISLLDLKGYTLIYHHQKANYIHSSKLIDSSNILAAC